MPRRKGSAAVRKRTPRSADKIVVPSPLLLKAKAESAVAVRRLQSVLEEPHPDPARLAEVSANALSAVAALATLAAAAARRAGSQ